METGAQRRRRCDLVRAVARTMPVESAQRPQVTVAMLRPHGCGSSRRSLSLCGRALPVLEKFCRALLDSDVFEDRLSASARRHARGIEAVFSSWVLSFRMFASARSGGAASAIARSISSEALRPDLSPELRRVGTAFCIMLLNIRSERIDVAWEEPVLALRKDSGCDPSLYGSEADTDACCSFRLALATSD